MTHNYRSNVNRALGSRSPIIDIEHLQLFSTASIRELFERSGFAAVSTREFINRYSLAYWARLAPMPRGAKKLQVDFQSMLKLCDEQVVRRHFSGLKFA